MVYSDGRNTSPDQSNNEEQGQVKVLPPEERENFKGITIEAGDSGRQEQNYRGYYESDYRDPRKRVYVRHVNLSSSILNWVVFGLLVLTAIFVILPVFSFLIVPLIIPLFIFILISNLFRRR